MPYIVLVADACRASFYTLDHIQTGKLVLLETLEHPDSRKKWSELLSSNKPSGAGTHDSEDLSSPKEYEVTTFAILLARKLEELCYKAKDIDSVILVIPPHVHGIFKEHFKPKHAHTVINVIKDYTQVPKKELLERIREHVYS